MQRALFKTSLSILLVSLSALVLAQDGAAPSGYYPNYYHGATFTGIVVDGPGDVLTLQYSHGKDTKSFTGRFKAPCKVPTRSGVLGDMTPADVPLGETVEALYYTTTKKVDGKDVRENWVIAISFKVVNGKKIPEQKRLLYPCDDQPGTRHFKTFAGEKEPAE